jgi:hypothetical protein
VWSSLPWNLSSSCLSLLSAGITCTGITLAWVPGMHFVSVCVCVSMHTHKRERLPVSFLSFPPLLAGIKIQRGKTQMIR